MEDTSIQMKLSANKNYFISIKNRHFTYWTTNLINDNTTDPWTEHSTNMTTKWSRRVNLQIKVWPFTLRRIHQKSKILFTNRECYHITSIALWLLFSLNPMDAAKPLVVGSLVPAMESMVSSFTTWFGSSGLVEVSESSQLILILVTLGWELRILRCT